MLLIFCVVDNGRVTVVVVMCVVTMTMCTLLVLMELSRWL